MSETATTADLATRADWLRDKIGHHQRCAEDLLRPRERVRVSAELFTSVAARAEAHAVLAQSYQRELAQIEATLDHRNSTRFSASLGPR